MVLLPVNYDGVRYAESDDVYDSWKGSLQEHQREIELFVADLMNDHGPVEFIGTYEGSYNIVFRFRFASGGSDVAFRCPKPGHTAEALAREKTENEVAWMEFIRENTTIPLPRIHRYGTEPGSLSPLGLPYILMDWLPGDQNLREFLNGNPSNDIRSRIYRQIASFYIQLYRLPPFTGIGSLAKDNATGKWGIIKRPLTIDMHQFAIGIHNFSTTKWPTKPLENSTEYFEFVVSQQTEQLWSLRNLNDPFQNSGEVQPEGREETISEMARRRYKARYGFSKLVPQFCEADANSGPFHIFMPDMDSRNMLVDSATGNITAFFDVEFTIAVSRQFSRGPPLWLRSCLPDKCLDNGFFDWFRRGYEPLLEQFLEAMELEEKELPTTSEQIPLSTHMRESWTSDRVWFNYAATHTDNVDSVYWAVLYKYHPGGIDLELPPDVNADMERYVQHTKEQMVAYEKALDQRLGFASVE